MKSYEAPFERISLTRLVDSITANHMMLSFTDTCGLFLCHRGQAELHINNQRVHIQAGDAFVYLPTMYVHIVGHSDDIEGTIYKSTLSFVLPLVETNFHIHNIIELTERPYVSLTALQMDHLDQLIAVLDSQMALLDSLPRNGEVGTILQREISLLGEAVIQEVLFCYFSNRNFTPAVQDNKDHITHAFMAALLEHYKQERQVTDYADRLCITPRYLSAVVKERTGRTAQQWIIDFVINSIKQSLLYTQKSIKEIALEYNFPTQSFFGKYFKLYTNMSPKEFRRQTRLE
ncbi:MAG: AraC family transcriptional regulator [Bacteroidaceae bacterium]|nr:AraC family transcriptional regulator [Bacteroidaceae bacterium]